MNVETSIRTIPDHVPPELVVDLDVYHLPGAEIDPHTAWRSFQGRGPLVWSPYNGGHWVATRGRDVARFYRDAETFSSETIIIQQPKEMERMLPLQAVAPDHSTYRANIQVLLNPKAVTELEASIRELAIGLIEEFLADGECEFMTRFALQFPLIIFLKMMGLPLEDREYLRERVETFSYNPDPAAKMQAHVEMQAYLDGWIQRRIDDPGEDAISRITRSTINGRPYTRQEMQSTFSMMLLAGLDTVAMMLGFVALHLARNPQDRRYIIDNPAKMNNVIQELLRRYAGPHMTRELAHDHVHEGVLMKKGDLIILPNALFNIDPENAEDPDTVDFTRDARHITFGSGAHVCAGALLARKEMAIFIEEWLRRIPDFEVDPARPVEMKSATQNCVTRLWLRWPSRHDS
jgi:cytochrome P450